MIGVDRNVDFRYEAGHPGVDKALADGTRLVRCISLPEMEHEAANYLTAGIRVLAVYTGESDAAGHYVLQNASAMQIGNEPQFAMDGAASWPTGSADDFVNVWNHVANVVVGNRDLPLVGPGIWAQDYAKWAQIAHRLPKLSAAAVHCYPEPSLQTVTSLRAYLQKYRAVRADLPLLCVEWTARKDVLAYARAIDSFCEARIWYGPAGEDHRLEGTPEFGILALTRS